MANISLDNKAQDTKDWADDIFKSYDIRGVFGNEGLTEHAAYAIGNALVRFLQAKTILVGFDNRASSPALFKALCKGIQDAGSDVVSLGLVATPLVYFATAHSECDGAVMITASHNPKEFNGFKLCRKNAVVIGSGSGLETIQQLANEAPLLAEQAGVLRELDMRDLYYNALIEGAAFKETAFTLIIDCANAMGIFELPVYERFPNLSVIALFSEYDATFPNHEANPHNPETLIALQEEVKKQGAHLGIAYDGDADRVGFVDEKGKPVAADILTALLAREILASNPGATIVYDLRSSRCVREVVQECGGIALESRVGHAHIKRLMREYDAAFAGELAQHYYYKEMSFAESSTRTALLLLTILHKTGKPLSLLVQEIQKYFHSGEINLTIVNKQAALLDLKEVYKDGSQSELDGLKVEYPTWWFCVRASNTEDVLRLVVEAETSELLEEKKNELLSRIQHIQ